MAIDSTELTFIRCPSCRSLVSALSKSCRMCGVVLTPPVAQEETKPEVVEKPARARQATFGDTGGELGQAAGRLRDNSKRSEPTPHISPDDPLSAFVTEVEEEVSPQETHGLSPEHQIGGDFDSHEAPQDFDIDEDGMVTLKEEKKEIPPPVKPQPKEPVFSSKAPMHTTWPGQAEPTPPAAPPKPAAPKVSPPVAKPTPKPTPMHSTPKPAAPKEHIVHEEDHSFEIPTMIPPKAETRAVPSKPKVTATGQRQLCGWFVDLSKEGGSYLEIREGRFFLSSQKLKEFDIVISDESISTPHALIAASAARGLKVQDLMSEGGVSVCRYGEEAFEQVYETTSLEHGDKIRFGAVEFVVCLIPIK